MALRFLGDQGIMKALAARWMVVTSGKCGFKAEEAEVTEESRVFLLFGFTARCSDVPYKL